MDPQKMIQAQSVETCESNRQPNHFEEKCLYTYVFSNICVL